jgi:hypothetical protein
MYGFCVTQIVGLRTVLRNSNSGTTYGFCVTQNSGTMYEFCVTQIVGLQTILCGLIHDGFGRSGKLLFTLSSIVNLGFEFCSSKDFYFF